jgi:Flp pilus assembly protein TadD
VRSTNPTLIERLQDTARGTDPLRQTSLHREECRAVARLATAARDVILNPEDRALREELARALVALGDT